LRNFIGPVSSICIRKNICPSFDCNLKWLTDVLFYIDIIEKRPRIHFFNKLYVVSEFDRASSITALLKLTPNFSLKSERTYLLKLKPYLSFYISASLPGIIWRCFEPFFWYPLVLVSRFFRLSSFGNLIYEYLF
jgi:hypothetical protein